jgi:hypothetical protein
MGMQSDNRLRVSRMRCSAKRCTADPGPPRTGTVHASRVYPTCAHWAPISGKPEIGVCRKTGKYRDRTNQRGARGGRRTLRILPNEPNRDFGETNPVLLNPVVPRQRIGAKLRNVSRAQRSTSEAKWCAADPGSSRSLAVPDQRRTAPLRFALHRIRDTWLV